MSTKKQIGNEVSHSEHPRAVVDDVVGETPEFRPTVELEIQAKVDLNNPEAVGRGLTLAEEERMEACEWEIEQTKTRWDRRQTSNREKRTATVAEQMSIEATREFKKRAGCVNRWADPDEADPREQLSREELGEVNREAARMQAKLEGWSRAAISRRLAEKVADGKSMMSTVVGAFEELQQAPGRVIPIAAVSEVSRREVSISGTVTQLWVSSNSAIQQVGLIEDETGRTKFTVWSKSRKPVVREGERVTMRNVAKSWYGGRVSVAVTGWSELSFPEREAWWAE
ncbi:MULTISPECIES: DNA-binding protein [unclassified Haloferax]|uniref:DNA-binding protein n=1 Tax=unclassified Haloferax TaxID=2625095 RepID=UPI00287466F8|nr:MULTISPECIES: DNA-binding protein [unclassified Haloferax]MDS0243757.1 DNA-binding protein [Haloferax sp. S2CR25]MDS0446878.1 DNA-binding protein [Haloferax sp. S2CR25-2]